jgi:hypothetical protein
MIAQVLDTHCVLNQGQHIPFPLTSVKHGLGGTCIYELETRFDDPAHGFPNAHATPGLLASPL